MNCVLVLVFLLYQRPIRGTQTIENFHYNNNRRVLSNYDLQTIAARRLALSIANAQNTRIANTQNSTSTTTAPPHPLTAN